VFVTGAVLSALALLAYLRCSGHAEESAQVHPSASGSAARSDRENRTLAVHDALSLLCGQTGLPVALVCPQPVGEGDKLTLDPNAPLSEIVPQVARTLDAAIVVTPQGWLIRHRGLRQVDVLRSDSARFERDLASWVSSVPDSLLAEMPAIDASTQATPVTQFPQEPRKRLREHLATLKMHLKGTTEGHPYDCQLHEIPPSQMRINLEGDAVAQFRCGPVSSVLEMEDGVDWIEGMRLVRKWRSSFASDADLDRRGAEARLACEGRISDIAQRLQWCERVDARIGVWYAAVWVVGQVPAQQLRDIVSEAAGLEIRTIQDKTHLGLSCDGHTWNVHEFVARWALTHGRCPVRRFESLLLRPRWTPVRDLTPEQLRSIGDAFKRFAQYNQELLKRVTWEDLSTKGDVFMADRLTLHVYVYAADPAISYPLREVTVMSHSASPSASDLPQGGPVP